MLTLIYTNFRQIAIPPYPLFLWPRSLLLLLLDNFPVDLYTAPTQKGQLSSNNPHTVIYFMHLGWLDFLNHTQ